jgi:hypothetical protein
LEGLSCTYRHEGWTFVVTKGGEKRMATAKKAPAKKAAPKKAAAKKPAKKK